LGLPVVLVSIFGFAIDLNVKNVTLAVADRDQTRPSRDLVEYFKSSEYFRLVEPPKSGLLTQPLDNEKAKAVLVIEPDFGRDSRSGRPGKAQVLLDGSDNSVTGVISGYLGKIEAEARSRLGETAPSTSLQLAPRFLFNPELN